MCKTVRKYIFQRSSNILIRTVLSRWTTNQVISIRKSSKWLHSYQRVKSLSKRSKEWFREMDNCLLFRNRSTILGQSQLILSSGNSIFILIHSSCFPVSRLEVSMDLIVLAAKLSYMTRVEIKWWRRWTCTLLAAQARPRITAMIWIVLISTMNLIIWSAISFRMNTMTCTFWTMALMPLMTPYR